MKPTIEGVQKEHKVINCHTHVFTVNHVPPYLAKSIVAWPFYYLLHTKRLALFYKNIKRSKNIFRFSDRYAGMRNVVFFIKNTLRRLGLIYLIFQLWLISIVVLSLSERFPEVFSSVKLLQYVMVVMNKLRAWGMLFPVQSSLLLALLVLFSIAFLPVGRNILGAVFKQFRNALGILPGQNLKELFGRYLNIANYAYYNKQGNVLKKLTEQYPSNSGLVILTMDMKYMDAGVPNLDLVDQLEELARLKKIKTKYNDNAIYPFVFVDPRRIKEDPDFFKYHVENGEVVLDACLIKEYLVDKKFSGLKIYPALGYYPFDPELLPLFKYAADNQFPILTHCIRGIIYYRGKKKTAWNHHPVFRESSKSPQKLSLTQHDNKDFSINFTHPLNYLCLLDEYLLRHCVAEASDEVKNLFGYTDPDTKLASNLKHLKLCFGHYGGEDEWLKFMEDDRGNYSKDLITHPDKGIEFMRNAGGELSWDKLKQNWFTTDWYAIISSMMLQYEHVYSDISYIVHQKEHILPLLKQSLVNDKLKKKILFGTDFYVVRNHKSERQMLAEMRGGMNEMEFDLIARTNPIEFLNNGVHDNGPVG